MDLTYTVVSCSTVRMLILTHSLNCYITYMLIKSYMNPDNIFRIQFCTVPSGKARVD